MRYIRLNAVDAEPMKFGEFKEKFPKSGGANAERRADEDGYIVTQQDCVLWCPKTEFEKNHFTDDECAPSVSIPDADNLFTLLKVFHDSLYLTCSKDEKAAHLVRAYYNEYVGRENGFLTFGMAIEAMKRGKRVTRKGWNDRRTWISFEHSEYIDLNMAKIDLLHIAMRMSNGTTLPDWSASQTDILSEDWQIVE